MPEAPNNNPPSWPSRGSSFSTSIHPTVEAPPLTDYADLNTAHQGHAPTYPTVPTIFTGSTTRNNNHGDVHVHTDHISWPNDGQGMYLVPPMLATVPGSLQSTTDDHDITYIHQFSNGLIPQPYIESFENMSDAIVGMGPLNTGAGAGLGSGSMQEDIAEPRTDADKPLDELANNVGGRVANILSLSDGKQTWSDMCKPFMNALNPSSVQSVGSGSTARTTCLTITCELIFGRSIRQQGIPKYCILHAVSGWLTHGTLS
ncbi:hypothetical protein AnigIFM59636_003273 [Aspergillus niger]|nr:hypothetical protein AnigIFM59636_003273 [Aspergillus niger]